MRRVLILAYYFPPIAASGSMRPAGFCAHLPSLDYQPMVLSADYRDIHPPISLDQSLGNLLRDDLDVRLVTNINWQKKLLDLRSKLRRSERGGESNQGRGANEKNDDERVGGCSLKNEILYRLFRFPDQQRGWARAVQRYANTLSEQEKPDVVLATANPWSALLAGAKIAARWDVPFVADFRDPWVNNPKPPLTPSLGRKSEVLERRVLARATKIIANTPELGESFTKRYPSFQRKFTVITNGYHQSLADKFAVLPGYKRESDGLELCYFGSIYELRKPTELLIGIKRFLDEQSIPSDQRLVRFTGNWLVTDAECNRLADELEQRGAIVRESSVSHDEYLAALKRSQYLLILQQDFPLQIPAKIYEYMASGRPIIVVGGEGATANLVERAGLGTVCPNDPAAISQMLAKLFNEPIDVSSTESSAHEAFSYANLTKKLADCLNDSIDIYGRD